MADEEPAPSPQGKMFSTPLLIVFIIIGFVVGRMFWGRVREAIYALVNTPVDRVQKGAYKSHGILGYAFVSIVTLPIQMFNSIFSDILTTILM